jgi:hypothetical protein
MTRPTQPPMSGERLDRLVRQLMTERAEDVAAAALTADAMADRLATRLRPLAYGRTLMLLAAAALLVALAAGAIALGSGILRPMPSDLPSRACLPTQPAEAPLSEPHAGGAWSATGPMVNQRPEGHTVTVLMDGTVLVAGGTGAGEAEIFDPQSGNWAATQSMLVPRMNHTATLLQDGRVLVAGGESALGSGGIVVAELYDPESGTWMATGGMGVPRAGASAVLLPDCTVLVVGGFQSPTPFPWAEMYDPATGAWSALPDPELSRAGGVASMTLLRDGRVLVSDGLSRAGSLYDYTTRSWSSTAPMIELGGGSGTATLLNDGRVLFAGGGIGDGSPSATRAQLYDPARDTWTEASAMNEGHAWHTAALLPDGSVLVAGAGDGGYGGSSAAERYDPATNTWTAVASMLQAHGWHSGATLHDGRVLVVGGYGDAQDPANPGAEVYDPSAGE